MKDVGAPRPQTLDEAILHSIFMCPLENITEQPYHVISDFLAEKFAKATLKASPESEALLRELFKELTKRPLV
jgi:hypothetical protein